MTYGFEERIEREDVDEHLDGLVAALQALGEEGKVRSGIITWRGMMTRWVEMQAYSSTDDRIMTAPFSQDAWEMNVVGLDGAVYIELHDPPEERAQRWAGYGKLMPGRTNSPAGHCRATWDMLLRRTLLSPRLRRFLMLQRALGGM